MLPKLNLTKIVGRDSPRAQNHDVIYLSVLDVINVCMGLVAYTVMATYANVRDKGVVYPSFISFGMMR